MSGVWRENGVVVSPECKDPREIPEVSITSYILDRLRPNVNQWKDRPWVVDVSSGASVTFGELEGLSLSVASALSRRGFLQNQVLYYVTFDMAYMYVMQFAVWRLGGAVRGCYQLLDADEYVRQIKETKSQFVLMDPETAPTLKKAIATLDYEVTMLSIGEVEGATSMHLLMQDDGSAFPKNIVVNSREDVITFLNTSGSTGVPKGVMHTHYSTVAMLNSKGSLAGSVVSAMTSMCNYGVGNYMVTLSGAIRGTTLYLIPKFKNEEFHDLLIKYKPRCTYLYPFVATWFSRCPELDHLDLTFLDDIVVGGALVDATTTDLLALRLPKTKIIQLYGMSECMPISTSDKMCDPSADPDLTKDLTIVENQGEKCVSAGKLLQYVQAKIVDPDTKKIMGPGERGEILINSPQLMKGYYVPGEMPNRSKFDQNGWFSTGDIGFFDTDGNIYINERISFVFKYLLYMVSPSELETILQEHPAVQTAGVVGVPHPESTSEARAYVVLQPGHVTEGEEGERMARELVQWVGARVPHYKHLHGGVHFLPSLPVNRGGKLDRQALKKLAMNEIAMKSH